MMYFQSLLSMVEFSSMDKSIVGGLIGAGATFVVGLIGYLVFFGRKFEKIDKLEKEQDKQEIKKVYEELHSSYEIAMKSFFTNDKQQAEEVAKKRVPFFVQCASYLKKNQNLQSALLVEQWKEMKTLICNVAKIVMDHE